MVGRPLHIVHPHGRSEDSHSPRRIGPFWKESQKSMETGILGIDRICAVVAASDAASMRRQLVYALGSTRTVELRLDWLSSVGELTRFLAWLASRRVRARLIATCRRRQAGGRFRGSIAEQLFHLAEAIRAGCAWYDLEVESSSKCPRELLDVLLGEGHQLSSAHFFRRMPENLNGVARRLARQGPHAIKIAAQCDSLAECRRLLRFARTQRNFVAVPMGDAGLPARLLALREGSAFTYAPVENSTAPGQISLKEMTQVYRADRLDQRTRVYGVIGDPIAHSLSPVMQNAGFAARRMNAVYLPFLVRDLRDFLEAIEPLGIGGFSVTLPHKERILEHLDGYDRLVSSIGAVNTVVVRGGGKLYGHNTDYEGVLRTLESRFELRASRVLIVGAGGAARAVAFALAGAGAAVSICSRRKQQAKTMAKAVGGEVLARQRVRQEYFDAIVNATPVGMYPLVKDSPLEERELNCRLVFDTIYRPPVTRLLQLASRRGIETVSGVEMFVRQGTAQWEIWTGQRAPVEAMRRAVVRALEGEERDRGAPDGKKRKGSHT
jgi:3-dehydroquinate dehydratase/shikimate dehydrogenase